MLCRFAHVQSVTFFAHAVVCTVIQRRGRGSATFGPDCSRHTLATSVEDTDGPRCIPSAAVGPAARYTPAPPVRRVPAGPTAPGTPVAQPRPRCLRAAAVPGRASRSTTPSRRLACGDLAGGPPPSGTKTGSPGPEGTANPDGEQAVDPTAPGVPVTQPRPRRYKTRARHSTEYRARRRL